jgi:predicted outer membrane protein
MKTSKEITQTVLCELKDTPKGFDNTKLIEVILSKWETEIRMDQMTKDHKEVMESLNKPVCSSRGYIARENLNSL